MTHPKSTILDETNLNGSSSLIISYPRPERAQCFQKGGGHSRFILAITTNGMATGHLPVHIIYWLMSVIIDVLGRMWLFQFTVVYLSIGEPYRLWRNVREDLQSCIWSCGQNRLVCRVTTVLCRSIWNHDALLAVSDAGLALWNFHRIMLG